MNYIIFLNENSGAIQAISTVILIVITIWYAHSTQRMAKIMKDQITPKLIIENIYLGSPFLEKWFLERKFDESTFLDIKLIFDIRNESSGSGSIYKPDLIIGLENDCTQTINPTTKSYETYNHKEVGSMTSWETKTINHGGSIFLEGGSANRIELEYRFIIREEDSDKLNFIAKAQKDPTIIKYTLTTKDNLGRKYNIPIINIQKESNFEMV